MKEGASPAAAPKPAPTLRVRLYGSVDSLEDLGGPWDDLVQQAGGSIFQTSVWVRAWWEAFGDGKRWHVVGVWAGDRLVGLAPFCWERTRSGARRLRTLGSPQADYGGILAAPELAWSVAKVLGEAVYEDRSWDVLWMPEVPQQAEATHQLIAHLRERGARSFLRTGCTCRVPLPRSWPEYLARLSRSTRKRLLQKARRLEELGAEMVCAKSPWDSAVGIDAFVRLHTARWKAQGRYDLFMNAAEAHFHRRLTAALAERNWLDLCWLRVGGSALAAVYDFRFGKTVYSYLSAVDLHRMHYLSPGIVLTLWRIRAAIEDGQSWYDLLRGDEPYKRSLGALPSPTFTYQVIHNKRWRGWWYLALGPLRDRMLRKEAMKPRALGPEANTESASL